MKRMTNCIVALACAVSLSSTTAEAQSFSIGVGSGFLSPTAPQAATDDLFTGPQPRVVLRADGPNSPITVNVDAFSFGRRVAGPTLNFADPSTFDKFNIDFSIDSDSTGDLVTPNAVAAQLATETAHCDVFRCFGLNPFNVLLFDGDTQHGIDETRTDIAGLDGFDDRGNRDWTPPNIYFSVRNGDAGQSGQTIFVSTAANGFAPSAQEYIADWFPWLFPDDEINALEILDGGEIGVADEGDVIFFSITPDSPSALANFIQPGEINVMGVNAAGDLIPITSIDAWCLGLHPLDDLNALSISIAD